MAEQPSARLWRCAECRKWSHAKSKPRHHQRWIGRDEEPLPEGAIVVGEIEAYGGEYADPVPGGWFIRCGPFDEWRAERVA